MFKNLMLLSLPLSLCTAIATADVNIDQFAPEQSVVIVSVSNVQASLDRLKETKLWDLWEAPQLRALRKEYIEPMTKNIEDLLTELGVEKDTLTLPQGGVGLSIFSLTPEEFGDATSGIMLIMDYGDNADKTAELIKAAIDRGEEDGVLEYEIQEIGELSVYTFIISQDEEGDDDAEDDMMGGMGMGEMVGMPELPDKIHYVQNGSVFMLCTDLESLTNALDDEDNGSLLADREDYQAVTAQLGEAEATAIILIRDLPQLVAGDNPMAGMMVGMVTPFIGDIKAVGGGLRLHGDKAMIESSYAVYMPDGKVGLTAMLDTQTPYGELPPFVGQNTISYSRFNFEFDKLPDFVMQLLGMIGPMMGGDPAAMQEADAMVRRLCSMLGNEIHTVTTLDRPIDADSQAMVFAVKCTKPLEFENFMAEMGPKAGFEPRDFLGQRIFTLPGDVMGMMGMPGADDFSIGIGSGFILMGSAAGVEQAMRAGGEAELPTLDSDEQYSRAVAVLPEDPVVAAGYSNTIDMLEAFIKSARFNIQAQVAEMREFDPEYADEFEAEALEGLKAFESIDIDLLRKHIGQSVWFVKSTDEGFIIRSYMLAPNSDE